MQRYLYIFLLLACPAVVLGQDFFKKMEDVFTSDPKLVVKLDSRNSFITTKNARIFGIKAGLEFDETFEVGLGYYWLFSRIMEDIPVQNATDGIDVFPARLKYRYLAVYMEYVFYRKDNFEFSAPFQIGAGNSFYKYRNELGKRRKEDFGPALSIEPGAEANYEILPWLSFGLGIGYRIMLINNPNIDERFSAPIYVIKLNIVPKPAYEQMKKWAEKL